MKKKPVFRSIPALTGMGLILFGIIWICAKVTSPRELNAAPGPIRTAQRQNTVKQEPVPQPELPAESASPLDASFDEITFDSEPAGAAPFDDSSFFQESEPAEPEPTLNELPESAPSRETAPFSAPGSGLSSPPASFPISAPQTVPNTGNPVLPASPRPGTSDLEGTQTAQLVLVKEIPEEISYGAEASYFLHIKNAGNATAHGVVVRDAVPDGAQLVSCQPPALPGSGSELSWAPFDMKPNEERVFECRFIPETEGVIGTTATVTFAAEASGRTTCTRPQLRLLVSAPEKVMIGETVKFDISITNTGTGTAKGVTLLENVPDGFRHPSGKTLNNLLGDLKPGETKKLALSLQAMAPGPITNVMNVTTDSGLTEEAATEVSVNAPELSLEIVGSKQRYLEREAVYHLKVWNPGSAPAKGVKLTAQLPKEMKFVRTNNEGVYQESTHSVHWELVELPEKTAPGEIELVLSPEMTGTSKLVFKGEDNMQLSASTEQEITIDGMSALTYKINSMTDTVELGGNALFEIDLVNRGTKEATNATVTIDLPAGMEAVNMEGPTRYSQQGSSLVFAPISKIGPREETSYKLKVTCSARGDQRLRVIVAADGMDPLTKEESVRVY